MIFWCHDQDVFWAAWYDYCNMKNQDLLFAKWYDTCDMKNQDLFCAAWYDICGVRKTQTLEKNFIRTCCAA